MGAAWRLIGRRHQLAWRAWQACRDDVYIVNPMSDAKHMLIRILPEALTASMREFRVPADDRASVREVVKMLQAWSQGDEPPVVVTACRLWFEHGLELCPRWDAGRGVRDLRCKCWKYWSDFTGAA